MKRIPSKRKKLASDCVSANVRIRELQIYHLIEQSDVRPGAAGDISGRILAIVSAITVITGVAFGFYYADEVYAHVSPLLADLAYRAAALPGQAAALVQRTI